ncbi:hypothetical protein [Paenibacillus flagellatus]|uniref:SLH domain-containing protein n=1 Tax=Paenibacillus flagellatus TaxID=2211139 RepID=A0A2V5K8M0_9BACL|nr:hypothetical protein [Paenibacillus flagellatus]PYI55222.1 hypothetical protein DLM86_11925 [Paenibacillus flagellatus]
MYKPLRTSSGKWLASVVLSAALLASPLLPTACAAAAAASAESAPSTGEYAAFLKSELGIDLPEAATKGDFIRAVARIVGDGAKDVPAASFGDLKPDSPYYAAASLLHGQGILTSPDVGAERPLDPLAATFIAVKAAGLKELAYTYPAGKAAASLAKAGIDPSTLTAQAAQEIAAAIDSGLVPDGLYDTLRGGADAAVDDYADALLGRILTFRGQYKHYIGYAADDDIYTKLIDAYETSDIIDAPALRAIVNEALKQNKVTGYNLKDKRYDANFDESLAIAYGHDDIRHAVQLIGLLRSEGLNAKVQFEPKTSAFVYLKEWGEPKETDSYRVERIENGNYIAYAKEYDLVFEFATAEDKAKFQPIVLAYAKKNEDDQPGLLAGSWWQPLYYSLTELSDYRVITNNVIADGHYYAQSFSLNEKSADIVAAFRQLDPKADVTTYTFWVDQPFYNYLNGESK